VLVAAHGDRMGTQGAEDSKDELCGSRARWNTWGCSASHSYVGTWQGVSNRGEVLVRLFTLEL
jgi:hypothetical protein